MLITKYFEITVKNLQDYVIKALWQFLINGSKDHIYQVLVSELYNQDLVDSLCEVFIFLFFSFLVLSFFPSLKKNK